MQSQSKFNSELECSGVWSCQNSLHNSSSFMRELHNSTSGLMVKLLVSSLGGGAGLSHPSRLTILSVKKENKLNKDITQFKSIVLEYIISQFRLIFFKRMKYTHALLHYSFFPKVLPYIRFSSITYNSCIIKFIQS